MAIYLQTMTLAGRDALLMLAEPNTGAAIKIAYACDTDVDEGVTGREQRHPGRPAPLLGISYDTVLDDGEMADVRATLGSLGNRLVAVPLWPDLTNAAGWTQRLHASQLSVGWDAGFSNVNVASGGAMPAGAFKVPLVIGILSRETIAAITQEGDSFGAAVGRWKVRLTEESPWSARIVINGEQSAWIFAPNWADEPTQDTRDLIRRQQVGRGRERTVEGIAIAKWAQRAGFTFLDREALRTWLAFWAGKRGSYAAFPMTGFLQPGTQTTAAPHNFDGGGRGFMRFGQDRLEVNYLDYPDITADCSADFEQVFDTTSEEIMPHALLFKIWHDLEPGNIARVTEYAAPIEADGHVWQPARIESQRIRTSLKPQNEVAEVSIYIEDVPQVLPLVRHENIHPLWIEVYEADLSDPVVTRLLFTGRAQKPRLKDKLLRIEASAYGGAMSRQFPRFQRSRTCQFAVFSAGCARRRPSQMNPANWMGTGQLKGQWGGSTVSIDNLAMPSAFNGSNGWFTGGWLEIGEGLTKQVRPILGDAYYSGDGEIHFNLKRPIRLDVADFGDPVKFWPGCNGRFDDAGGCPKFGNQVAFGGAPYAPSYIQQRPAHNIKAGK